MPEEKKLNQEQLEAVQYGEGPLLIIAGAGTGKTTVITERIKWLVSQGRAKPAEILALTFTDKAAREMEERVDIAMPYGYTQMWISTFHAFCDRILRQEALHIGLDPRYNILTGAETIQFLRQELFKFDLQYFRPLGNPTKFLDGLIQHFARLKDEDVSPEEYFRFAQNQKFETEERTKTLELAKAYETYEKLKIKESVMDFGDLIINTLKLFRTRKNVLEQYQDQFKYILVDEFQDTNYAQYELLKILAPPETKPNLTVVGDDSQSIYKFRGAAVSNILQFMDEYKEAKQVILTKNYRSSQTILDHAYRLIKHNDPDTLEAKLGISKDLKKMREVEEAPIEFLHADRVENEAEAVVREIKKLTADSLQTTAAVDGSPKAVNYGNIAILVRANNHADAFVRALIRAGIPYQFLGPGMLFRQPEVKDLIAYLKVLANFEDSVAMYRVLAMDFFEIAPRDLAAISNFAKKQNLSIFEACEKIEIVFVSQETKEKAGRIVKMIHRHLELIKKETAGQILYYFLENSGLLRRLTDYNTQVEERRTRNISKFFDKLKTYEVDHENASVFAVSDWIDLSMELGESPLAADLDWTGVDAVNLLTVHSAKGLEFPVVFLVNLVSQRFPTLERREQIPIPEALIREILPAGDYHLEEERRLFYVGMTRARDRLFFSAANYYGEAKRERKISPFVIETLGDKAIERLSNLAIEGSQLSFLDWQKKEADQLPVPDGTELGHLSVKSPINYLSYSQIDIFDTCPLQYRYRYIQRIPAPPSGAQSFGDAIHKTLFSFYRMAKEGKNLTKDDLLGLLDENWSPLGYASKAHEEKMKRKGGEILTGFFEKAYDPKRLPRDLEQIFTIRVAPDFKIGGKIDRVDELENGKIEIIDYKTGRVPTPIQVEKSLQMTVYALAAQDEGIYGKRAEEVILSFYFFDIQDKISSQRTEKDLAEAKTLLLEKKKEIEKSDFSPIPGPWCDFCDYKLICEAWS